MGNYGAYLCHPLRWGTQEEEKVMSLVLDTLNLRSMWNFKLRVYIKQCVQYTHLNLVGKISIGKW